MTALVRTVTYLCLCILQISFEGCKGMWLFEQAGGRGLVRSVSHIEGCKGMWLLEQAGGRGLVRSVLHIEAWRAGTGVNTIEEDDARVCMYTQWCLHRGGLNRNIGLPSSTSVGCSTHSE